ncbi:MAG: PSD1 and planctomycete cytochrome C domain-containing protein, partial [Bryobacteraceae bacterium]
RPILAKNCHSCHGARSAFAGLRLHDKSPAMKGSDSGPVIVPGMPAESKLIRAVRGEGMQRMPPTGPLRPEEIATLVRWIEMGAPWPENQAPATSAGFDLEQRRRDHWSWQPVRTVSLPPGAAPNPIDHFLPTAAPPADRATLLRRVTFDLTGLPPLPEDIEALARNGNYEQAVDRLLASPRFGERMARRWMDVIRYSESHGSEGDPDVPMAWRFRDYLIRAFNTDVPYDQLIREQLAGDLLPHPRINRKENINESLLGVAHFRMVEHGFQPVEPWEDRVKWTDNQIDVFSKAFQGLTISCARCHDHKFDAISQKDYYSMFGILSGMRPTQVAIDSPDTLTRNKTELAALKPRIKAALAAQWRTSVEQAVNGAGTLFPLSANEEESRAWFEKWKKDLAGRAELNAKNFPVRWDAVASFAQWPKEGTGIPDAPSLPGEFAIEPSGSRAINGIYPAGVYSGLLSRKHGAVLTSPRFKIATDSISFQMLGGNFSLAQLIIENYAVPRGGIYNQRYSAKADELGWVRWDTTFWKGFTAYLEFATQSEVTLFQLDDEDNRRKPKPVPVEDGRSWFGARGVVFHDGKKAPQEELVPARLLVESPPASYSGEAVRQRLQELLKQAVDAWEADRLTDSQAVFLDYFIRQGLLPNSADTIPLIAEYRRLEQEIAVPRRAPGVMEEGPPDHPLLVRGDHKRLGAPVPRGYLTALGGPRYSDPFTMRLQLAEDVASARNPFAARVMVNRLWQFAFRTGIVATPDNFGKLGGKPSNPELLDWLASRFVADGWSIKKLLRLLVTSQAYQSSDLPIRRLEAEEIRDAILTSSGQMDLTMYGPSVPVYYAHDTGATKGDRPKGPLDGKGRRSIYLEIRRNATNPFLDAFDVYKPASTRGKRDVTNVPGQSLTLMNSPFVVDESAKWAEAAPSVDDLYLRIFGRHPTTGEIDKAQSYLAELTKETEARKATASLVQAMYNMKEFLYVR